MSAFLIRVWGGLDQLFFLSAQEENWERSNREFERTEYYNPNITFGVQDSVLRENGNIYDAQVDEIIGDIINNHGGVCPCGCGTVYESRDQLVSQFV